MKTTLRKTTQLILVSLFMLFSVTFVQAQSGGQQRGQQGPPPLPDEEQIENMVAELSDELALTESQEKQVSEMYFTHFEKVSEIVEDNKNSRPDREVMEQIRKDFETDVKSVLNKDQQKEFDAYMKKKKSQRGGRGKSRQ